ncbi:hypothetical protein K8I31_06705 [bacterium]|nr:hypothetical protein [bacterium]
MIEKCPLSGKPVTEGKFAIKDNMLVSFCCDNCAASMKKDPKTVEAKLAEAKLAPVILTLDQTKCPISGEPISKSVFATAMGKKVYMCCEACKDAFKAKPEEVLQALADEGIVPDKAS